MNLLLNTDFTNTPLECSSIRVGSDLANNRPEKKRPKKAVANGLAYYGTKLIAAVKFFTVLALGCV